MLGLSDGVAFAARGVLLLAMTSLLAWLWRTEKDFSCKCAGLCAATLLATPYLFLYDFPILSIAIAFLWRSRPFDRVETALLLSSQLAMAGFLIIRTPTGPIASTLVFLVTARRVVTPALRTAPLGQRV